jgi:hypothetical protein
MRVRIQFFILMRIRIQLLFKVMGICDLVYRPSRAPFIAPGLHCERPRLYSKPLKLLILTLMRIRIQMFNLRRIRIQLLKIMRIRIQLPKLMRIRNPDRTIPVCTVPMGG